MVTSGDEELTVTPTKNLPGGDTGEGEEKGERAVRGRRGVKNGAE